MVVASMPRQAPHGSDELAAADDAPRSEHNGTVPVLHATNPEMPFWGKGDWNSFFLLSFDNLSALNLSLRMPRAPLIEPWLSGASRRSSAV